MNENKKGYWVYSVLVVLFFVILFAFICYLIYDLIIKLSKADLSNNTIIQALITLVVTVFIGGYFSKYLELRNARKMQLFQVKKEISIAIINNASVLYYHADDTDAFEKLHAEASKVKLYFNDSVLKALNEYILSFENESNEMRAIRYDSLVDELKKSI